MSEQASPFSDDSWAPRGAGPPPRWYVYVAAFIVCQSVAGHLTSLLSGALDGMQGYRPGERVVPPGWFGLVTGAAAGLVWGGVFAWAVRLRLIFIIPILALGDAVFLYVAFQNPTINHVVRFATDEQIAMVDAMQLNAILHVAAFWPVFLVPALIARWRRRTIVAPA